MGRSEEATTRRARTAEGSSPAESQMSKSPASGSPQARRALCPAPVHCSACSDRLLSHCTTYPAHAPWLPVPLAYTRTYLEACTHTNTYARAHTHAHSRTHARTHTPHAPKTQDTVVPLLLLSRAALAHSELTPAATLLVALVRAIVTLGKAALGPPISSRQSCICASKPTLNIALSRAHFAWRCRCTIWPHMHIPLNPFEVQGLARPRSFPRPRVVQSASWWR